MAPIQEPQDPAYIKNLMLLWLSISTPVGDGNGAHMLQQMTGASAAAGAARASLATSLRVDPTVVKLFVDSATTDPRVAASIQSVQNLFHILVKNSGGTGYEGPFCPRAVSAITELLPNAAQSVAAVQGRKTKPTMADLRAMTTQRAALTKAAAGKKSPAKKSVAKKTAVRKSATKKGAAKR